MKAARGLTVQGMCHLAEVSRAGFYRRWLPAVVPADEVALRDAVQRVALEWPLTAAAGSAANCTSAAGW